MPVEGGETEAYVGLGANLGDPVRQVRQAVDELDALPSTACERCSGLYSSKPLGPVDQPDYVNAVACLRTRMTAETLLKAMHVIEQRHGRERGVERWGPRTLDLDLLLYGNLQLRSPDLTVPHPHLHERAFVLYPLFELAPDLLIPGHGALEDLLSACPPEGLHLLEACSNGR